VTTTAPARQAYKITMIVEAHAGMVVPQTIFLRNFSNGTFEQVDTRNATTADSTVQLVFTANASRFIDPNTKQIVARLRWGREDVDLLEFQARIDMVRYVVEPMFEP
jgi:hypothetical protein